VENLTIGRASLLRQRPAEFIEPSANLPHLPAAVKSAGADFVFIDAEHIAIDRTTLPWMRQTYRALGLAPIVRIPSSDPYQAIVALDNGASGDLAPYVETPEQAKSHSNDHRQSQGP
jgi:4-hydroxy-2-oxoheptanedioate aldolase